MKQLCILQLNINIKTLFIDIKSKTNKHGGCVSTKPETFVKQTMLFNVCCQVLFY